MDEIAELIDIYLARISRDHHKTKDGYFEIQVSWFGYEWMAPSPVKPKWRAVHNGYINRINDPIDRDTFEEAAEDLRDFLVECIAEYKDEDWGWDEDESEATGIMDEGKPSISQLLSGITS